MRPRDVISSDVTTTSSCEVQPCTKWNVQYTRVFDLLLPLSGDFRSNDVTYGSPPVTWDHVMSSPVTWPLPPASYSLVARKMYSIRQFLALHSHFQVTSGQMTSLRVTFGHLRSRESFPVTWLPPASYSLVRSEMFSIRQFSAFHSHFQVTSGQMTSIPAHFRSPEVMWHHFLSRDCVLLRATAL